MSCPLGWVIHRLQSWLEAFRILARPLSSCFPSCYERDHVTQGTTWRRQINKRQYFDLKMSANRLGFILILSLSFYLYLCLHLCLSLCWPLNRKHYGSYSGSCFLYQSPYPSVPPGGPGNETRSGHQALQLTTLHTILCLCKTVGSTRTLPGLDSLWLVSRWVLLHCLYRACSLLFHLLSGQPASVFILHL